MVLIVYIFLGMSCRDFILFGSCERKFCVYAHDFLFCQAQCHKNTCKRFHLTKEEIQPQRSNCRPFNEKVQYEVGRIAYIYKKMFGEQSKLVCTRIVTGLNKCAQECNVCDEMQKEKQRDDNGEDFILVVNCIYN